MSVRQGYPQRTFVGFGGYRKSVGRQLIPRKMALRGFPPAMFAPLSDLYEALARLQKNRDEMLEDFEIRKRPGHPYDFIVIAKFRSFVDGRRIYSAGNKTRFKVIETAKLGYGRMIGHRWKRIGNSDYTYEIYGLRYQPLKWPQTDGKLFDNARKHSGTIWKLQFTDTIGGVADVKESIDGGGYQTATFAKKSEAQAEAMELRKLGHRVRIVPFSTEADRDIYANSRKSFKLQIGGVHGFEDVTEEVDGSEDRRVVKFASKEEAMREAREFKRMGYATRILRANPRPRTYMEERAEKIARMREEGFEPLPQGLGKATKLQLKLLGHGKAFYSRKWGERVKRTK